MVRAHIDCPSHCNHLLSHTRLCCTSAFTIEHRRRQQRLGRMPVALARRRLSPCGGQTLDQAASSLSTLAATCMCGTCLSMIGYSGRGQRSQIVTTASYSDICCPPYPLCGTIRHLSCHKSLQLVQTAAHGPWHSPRKHLSPHGSAFTTLSHALFRAVLHASRAIGRLWHWQHRMVR